MCLQSLVTMGTSSILKHSSHSFGEEASGFIGMEMIFLNLSVIYCFVFLEGSVLVCRNSLARRGYAVYCMGNACLNHVSVKSSLNLHHHTQKVEQPWQSYQYGKHGCWLFLRTWAFSWHTDRRADRQTTNQEFEDRTCPCWEYYIVSWFIHWNIGEQRVSGGYR